MGPKYQVKFHGENFVTCSYLLQYCEAEVGQYIGRWPRSC
jgi:hypothetical protein